MANHSVCFFFNSIFWSIVSNVFWRSINIVPIFFSEGCWGKKTLGFLVRKHKKVDYLFYMALHFFHFWSKLFFFSFFDHNMTVLYFVNRNTWPIFSCTYCFNVCVRKRSIHVTLLTFGYINFTSLKILVHP